MSLTLCKFIREATESVENVEKIETGRTEQIFYGSGYLALGRYLLGTGTVGTRFAL